MERFIRIHDRPEFRDMQLQLAITLEQNSTIRKIYKDTLEKSRRKVASLRVEENKDEGSAGTSGFIVRTLRGQDVETGARNVARGRVVDEGAAGTSGLKVLRTLTGEYVETGARNAARVRVVDGDAAGPSRVRQNNNLKGRSSEKVSSLRVEEKKDEGAAGTSCLVLRRQDVKTGPSNAKRVRFVDDGAAGTSGLKVLRTLRGQDLETGARNAARVRVIDGGAAGPSRVRQNKNHKGRSSEKVSGLRVEEKKDEGAAGTSCLVLRRQDVKTGASNAKRVRFVDDGAAGTSGPKVLRTLRGQDVKTGARNAARVRVIDGDAAGPSRVRQIKNLKGRSSEQVTSLRVEEKKDEGAAGTSSILLRLLKGEYVETGARNAARVRVVDGGAAGPSGVRQNNNLKMLYNEDDASSRISITKDAPALPLMSTEYYNDLYDEKKRRHLLPNFHMKLCMTLSKLKDVSFATPDNNDTEDYEDSRDENIQYCKEGEQRILFHYKLAERLKYLKHERKWLSDSGYFRRECGGVRQETEYLKHEKEGLSDSGCVGNSGLPQKLERMELFKAWLNIHPFKPPESSLPNANDGKSQF